MCGANDRLDRPQLGVQRVTKPQSAGETRLLKLMLLDRLDMAAAVALACLHRTADSASKLKTNSPETMIASESTLRLQAVELDVIRWAAAGKSYQDIATIMNLPYGTVRYHLDQARLRNGCDTVVQLIVRAACDHNLDPLAA